MADNKTENPLALTLKQKENELLTATSEIEHLNSRVKELEERLAASGFNEEAVEEFRMAQLIVERSPVILFRRLAGDDPKLQYVSQNLKQFGYSPKEFFDGTISFRDIVHPDDHQRVSDEIQHYADADVEEYTMYYRCITRSGEVRWVEDQTSVVRNEHGEKTHNQGILFDITERKLAEDALRKSEEKFRRIVETTAEGFLLMNEELKIVEVNKAYCRLLGYTAEEICGKTPMDFATPEFKEQMLASKEKHLAKEYREFEGTVVAKDGTEIPILIHGNSLRNDRGQIIGNMAFITNMTEHKKALMLASEVQKSLLPQEKPTVQGFDIAGRNVSCDEIGGDYYDFIWRKDSGRGPFTVAVGDISGHGVDSALLMTTARAFLRMRASQPGSLSEIITAMNAHLTQDVNETGRFMTLFYLTLDHENKALSWVRAGHDPALLYDPATDRFEELKGDGIALGVMDGIEYQEHRRDHIVNDQIITIGTDGIWEAFNPEGMMFGKERLKKLIRDHAHLSAEKILNLVYDELRQFTSGQKSEDDITLVIIKVAGLA